jgi:hypothetical protein
MIVNLVGAYSNTTTIYQIGAETDFPGLDEAKTGGPFFILLGMVIRSICSSSKWLTVPSPPSPSPSPSPSSSSSASQQEEEEDQGLALSTQKQLLQDIEMTGGRKEAQPYFWKHILKARPIVYGRPNSKLRASPSSTNFPTSACLNPTSTFGSYPNSPLLLPWPQSPTQS